MQSKSWPDFTPAQRKKIILQSAVQLSLLIAALLDLHRRPAEEIKGSKKMWQGLVFVSYIGPIAYFLFGRKEPGCYSEGEALPEAA
jgi:hypothetical protein